VCQQRALDGAHWHQHCSGVTVSTLGSSRIKRARSPYSSTVRKSGAFPSLLSGRLATIIGTPPSTSRLNLCGSTGRGGSHSRETSKHYDEASAGLRDMMRKLRLDGAGYSTDQQTQLDLLWRVASLAALGEIRAQIVCV